MLVEDLVIARNWVCLASGILFCLSYVWAGYYVLATDKVQRFLISLWICFMTLSVLYMLIYVLIIADINRTMSFRTTIIILIFICNILYSVGHWIFCYQYYKSSTNIKNKIQGKVTDYQGLDRRRDTVSLLIIVSNSGSLIAELYKLYTGTYLFGDSGTILLVIWGLFTVICLFLAILKIRNVIKLYPNCKQSNTMMTLHLTFFGISEAFTIL